MNGLFSKKLRDLFIVISTLLLFNFPGVGWAAFEVKLSDTHIQSAISVHFPLRDYAAFARITLREPQVILSNDSNKLVLVIPVDANIPDLGLRQGHVSLSVGVVYNPGNGGLYLQQPKVIKFEMPSISKSLTKQLKKKLGVIGLNSFPLIRIYRVKEKELNHSLSKSVMKSFLIENSNIHMEFGFD